MLTRARLVDLTPSRERLEALIPEAERFFAGSSGGWSGTGCCASYYQERVFVDVALDRVATWPDLSAAGAMAVTGATWPGPADPQPPPERGTGPRTDVAKAAGRIAMLPHRVLAYRGADGFPVIVPFHLAGHDQSGLRLVVPPGLVPPGGRRAQPARSCLPGAADRAVHPGLHRLAGGQRG